MLRLAQSAKIRPVWDRCFDFLNIFAENLAKILAFLTQIKAKLCKSLIILLVFEKNANFFAENRQKSQKVVIITSTPGHPELDAVAADVASVVATAASSLEASSTVLLVHTSKLRNKNTQILYPVMAAYIV
jgi:purine nucleoside permease